MNPFTLPSQQSIDPQTGEVFTSPLPPYDPSKSKLNTFLSPFRELQTILKIAFILTSLVAILLVYLTLKSDIRHMYSQFDSLFQGVEESEKRVIHMEQTLLGLEDKLLQVFADEEEQAFENFWGDDDIASHLQSMKYIGHYTSNQQIFAHTKSILGNRFLSKNEKINIHWRVKEITEEQIVLIGDRDKTYTITKMESEQ